MNTYTILHEDEDIIIVDKPALLSTVPDLTDSGNSLQEMLQEKYGHDIHPITRLDKVVGGCCLYAKHKEAAAMCTTKLKNGELKKHYIAIVEGVLDADDGSLTNHLHKKGSKAYVQVNGSSNTKLAKLKYTVVKKLERYSIVKIELLTGRFHQIRAQFGYIGHAIKGDVKYGARRKNKSRAIYLHAYSIEMGDKIYIAQPDVEDSLWKLLPDNV